MPGTVNAFRTTPLWSRKPSLVFTEHSAKNNYQPTNQDKHRNISSRFLTFNAGSSRPHLSPVHTGTSALWILWSFAVSTTARWTRALRILWSFTEASTTYGTSNVSSAARGTTAVSYTTHRSSAIPSTAVMSTKSSAHRTAISIMNWVFFNRSKFEVVEMLRSIFAFDFIPQAPIIELRTIWNRTAWSTISSTIHAPSIVLSNQVRNKTARRLLMKVCWMIIWWWLVIAGRRWIAI